MAAVKKAPANKSTAKLPPEVDIEAIAERVTETTNSIMSRVIQKRDDMVAKLEALEGQANRATRTVEACRVEAGHLEARVKKAAEEIARLPGSLRYELDDIQSRLSVIAQSDDAKFTKLVGELVSIKSGSRVMVASGFDDEGRMICVYEEGGKVHSVAVPAMALQPASPPMRSA